MLMFGPSWPTCVLRDDPLILTTNLAPACQSVKMPLPLWNDVHHRSRRIRLWLPQYSRRMSSRTDPSILCILILCHVQQNSGTTPSTKSRNRGHDHNGSLNLRSTVVAAATSAAAFGRDLWPRPRSVSAPTIAAATTSMMGHTHDHRRISGQSRSGSVSTACTVSPACTMSNA